MQDWITVGNKLINLNQMALVVWGKELRWSDEQKKEVPVNAAKVFMAGINEHFTITGAEYDELRRKLGDRG